MKKLKILVVEDNLDYLKIAKSVFGDIKDLEVDYVTNRNDALLKLETEKYDGVITDRNMPSVEGGFLQLDSLPEGVRNVDPYITKVSDEVKKLIKSARSYDELQGDIVAYTSALVKETATLVHSWHGDSSSFSFRYRNWGTSVNKEELANILKKYSVTFKEYVENSLFEEEILPNIIYDKGWSRGSIKSPARIDSENRNVRKTDPESWTHALHLLKEWINWE